MAAPQHLADQRQRRARKRGRGHRRQVRGLPVPRNTGAARTLPLAATIIWLWSSRQRHNAPAWWSSGLAWPRSSRDTSDSSTRRADDRGWRRPGARPQRGGDPNTSRAMQHRRGCLQQAPTMALPRARRDGRWRWIRRSREAPMLKKARIWAGKRWIRRESCSCDNDHGGPWVRVR